MVNRMNRFTLAILLICMTATSTQAGVVQENLIFVSSFEGEEGCLEFDGAGDHIVIPVITISGDFLLNGESFPGNQYDSAAFSLRDTKTGAVTFLGQTHLNNSSYTANIVPGRYDVIYDKQNAGLDVPRNVGAVIMEDVPLWVDQTLDLEVTAFMISGDLMNNGAAFPDNDYDDGLIFLDSEQAGRVFVANTHDRNFGDLPVLGGGYEVRYQLETGGNEVPWNSWGHVMDVVIDGDNIDLDINVVSHEISGDFTHNGADFPAVEYEDGNFFLESDPEDRVFLGNSHDGNYSRRVIAGTYDAFWELESTGDTIPSNPRARVATKINVSNPNQDINVVSWSVSGDFSLNGGAFPVAEQQTGHVILVDKVADENTVLGKTKDGSYSRRIVQGSYELVYQHLDGNEVPQNKYHQLASGVGVSKARVIDVDVASRLFTASAFHNDALFPASNLQHGTILLRDPDSDDFVILGKTSEQHFSELVIPGTYDVYYSHLAGADVPVNFMARVQQGLLIEAPGPVLLGGGSTELHVYSQLLNGNFYRNDATPPNSGFDDGDVNLRREQDLVFLGNTEDGSYQARVVLHPDWYFFRAHYGVTSIGPQMPHNPDVQLDCVKVVETPF